jgi:hypothetical protein
MASRAPGFRRTERDGVVSYRGRDHLIAMGWWILVALVGGGTAFTALDALGPAVTGGFALGAIALGFLGQLSARFELRLEPDGPVLRHRLFGLSLRRLFLPKAVQARVMGLGDHGDRGDDGRNVSTELFMDGAMLGELWLGTRGDAAELAPAVQRDLRARYGSPTERLGPLGGNLPWLLRGLAWAQRSAGMMVPVVRRDGGVLTIDIPTDGLDADPREASFWVVIAGLALGALGATAALGLALGAWVAASVFALAVGLLAWRIGRALRIQVGPDGAFLIRRRFGFATWRLAVDPCGWSLRHAWWCGHPTGLAFSAPPGDDGALDLDRLKFGPVCCASAWSRLPPLEELLGPSEPPPASDGAGASRPKRRRRR